MAVQDALHWQNSEYVTSPEPLSGWAKMPQMHPEIGSIDRLAEGMARTAKMISALSDYLKAEIQTDQSPADVDSMGERYMELAGVVVVKCASSTRKEYDLGFE